MDQTPVLSLPYIAPSQAQKHVTHNEALRLLDILVQLAVISRTKAAPPGTPTTGDRYIVAAGGTGDWAGHDGKIAIRETTGWAFIAPVTGLVAYVTGDATLIVHNGTGWVPVPANLTPPDLQNLSGVGVNATPDTTNRLSVSAPATLFNHEGAGHQIKINKAAAGDTASLLYQTGWGGRAEMGLVGNDNFSLKVGSDSGSWTTALIIDRETGHVGVGVDAPSARLDVKGGVRPGQYATAGRPPAGTLGAGAMIYDTTLSKPLWSDGTVWRDAGGTAV